MAVASDSGEFPVLGDGQTPGTVTETVSDVTLTRKSGPRWMIGVAVSLALSLMLFYAIGYLLYKGVGIWGIDIPVAWGFAIANYVWWIAIGMGGTFISAALFILRKDWRSSLNRFAEGMTVFAVGVSGLFPILHLGRPWFFYWLAPYPNVMNLWPQWRSALTWDFFAILAYLIFSILFVYVGMIPDLGTLRDRARTRRKQVFYGLLALGWRGEARHWQRLETLSLLLAGFGVPLVFSVHSMVALDFSEGALPGWHSTLFPPFFVAGALYSGFAVVLALGLPMRKRFGLQAYITERHIDNMAKATLAAGLVVAYSYASEIFTAFYSMDTYEVTMTMNRFAGVYSPVFWAVIFCNVVQVQALWWRRVRANHTLVFAIAVLVIIGMWLERVMLILSSLYEDYLPSSWGIFIPTLWDWIFLAGSIGFFFLMYLLFLRFMPVLSMHELRKLAARLQRQEQT